MLPHFWHPEALAEFERAIEWHVSQETGRSSDLVAAVAKSLDQVRQFPESGRSVGADVRAKEVAHFPYTVIYRCDSTEIEVLAFAHQHRSPWYWKTDRR